MRQGLCNREQPKSAPRLPPSVSPAPAPAMVTLKTLQETLPPDGTHVGRQEDAGERCPRGCSQAAAADSYTQGQPSSRPALPQGGGTTSSVLPPTRLSQETHKVASLPCFGFKSLFLREHHRNSGASSVPFILTRNPLSKRGEKKNGGLVHRLVSSEHF